MGQDAAKKKKIAIAGLASLLLVAMVIGTVVSVTKKDGNSSAPASNNNNGGSISASTKAVKAICAPTDYKETCEGSLSNANTTDPKELIKVAFEATVKNIGDALKNSTLLEEAATDSRTKGAFKVCQEVLEDSIGDLKRSFEKVGAFDASKIDDYVMDVKTWLSAAITYQDTCIDAFENTTGDTGEKMKKLLKTANELSSNGLAMVSDFSSIFSSLQLGGFSGSRRLLSEEGRILYGGDPTDYAPGDEPNTGFSSSLRNKKGDQPPSFVKNKERKLMAATPASLTVNAVVAQDGSGQFKTISEAISKVPPKNNQTYVIHVKAGVYKETVTIPKKVNKIVLIGDGPLKTKITGNKNYADGVQTFQSATLAVNGDDFMAKDIGIENTAGPTKHQAVAVRVSGDQAIFHNVQMDGFQDTLYTHNYRQYYRDCTITGTIDFIFGDALAFFQNCTFIVRKPMDNQACMVTAQGRKEHRSVGAIIMQNCNIKAEKEFTDVTPALKAYLGRPWKEYSRTIIMNSNIEGFIAPEGWAPWMGTFALDTLYYGEYSNRGAGSKLDNRVTWKGIKKITPQIAESFTPAKMYIRDLWITNSGVPYAPGMF
ncbi:hypothetical protein RD792_010480 [Penstemon davidsonii]|uniref:Pectinesterase n=1 Tax=Penstemon davidsonii TaxID=160366 RepID=A0ABR0D2U4_9LAMI|nr:hypothetical protein RD792_010480 [Penstemon davidsonii]